MTKKGINKKYVALLLETSEKYRKLDVIESKTVEEVESVDGVRDCDSLKKPKVIKTQARLTKTFPKISICESDEAEHAELKVRRRKSFRRLEIEGRKVFTREEDDFLINYIKNTPNESRRDRVRELKKQMNRSFKSIERRLFDIEKGRIAPKRENKAFSLQEDQLIIDAAITNLEVSRNLKETDLPNYKELSKTLKNRNPHSLELRWNIHIKTWLLQYYNKTLNLQIKPMLANVLADNFDSFDSIDWKMVLEFKEFDGHTENSLRYLFYSNLVPRAISALEKERSNLTLKEIAKVIDQNSQRNYTRKGVKIRQRELIDYFETKLKEHQIETFL